MIMNRSKKWEKKGKEAMKRYVENTRRRMMFESRHDYCITLQINIHA